MDKTKSSVIKTNPKPVSVFYVWYSELCRRLNIHPSPFVKPAKPKSQTVLDFTADRLKVEDWNPIINALRQDTSLHVIAIRSRISNCEFLHEIDTEEKARKMKRKYGSIWTAYVLKQLLRSVSYTLKNTMVLTYLELDGLPLFMPYLEQLLQALKKNQTLKNFSLSNCFIQDSGCSMVCSYLRFTPNIEVLNLSGCHLTPASGESISKLIKYQQINRYCESWQNSLRYENPDSGKMRGLKRITLNSNPSFDDAGLNFILNELEDDLWIKALDLQKCGLTENISPRVLDVVESNGTLEIFDVRQNDLLNISTMDRILQLLKQRQRLGFQPEFQWCSTAVALTWTSVHSTVSKSTVPPARDVYKTKSAPMKNSSTFADGSKVLTVRKTRTVDRIPNGDPAGFASLSNTKQQLQELNEKLNREIKKRKEIEKINHDLQNQLNQIRSTKQTPAPDTKKSIPTLAADKTLVKVNGIKKGISNNIIAYNSGKLGNVSVLAPSGKEDKKTTKQHHLKNGYHKNGLCTNGVSINFKNSVYSVFEKLFKSGHLIDENEVFDSFTNDCPKTPTNGKVIDESLSNSQMSLYNYMEALKSHDT
ncbi:protein Cep78 homolog [Cylas formicarius]|uniref:protein Cep78 homolog n=1 Tax=Cylas formicarius TaxID=197179 RepID=UPI002958B82B|nr:protein Cep78 homolog [Cylas formicarius]